LRTYFPDHTVETAPVESRRSMTASVRKLGYLPAPVGRLASSPELLDGFLRISGLFEASTLDPLARETVILTIATRNECHVCVAMHTAALVRHGASDELIDELRSRRPLGDARLEAVRVFTLDVLARAGAVAPEAMEAFLARGFTPRNALEVVLGIGAYTMSTFANRMTDAPLDEPLAAYAWQPAGSVSSR
jgi:AhpD family alkylhydroperoxidase